LINQLVAELSKRFAKVVQEQQGRMWMLTLYDSGEPKYVLCLSTGMEGYVYGKLTLLEKTTTLNCVDALYSPLGLYIFAENPLEFVEKLRSKLKLLHAQSSITRI